MLKLDNIKYLYNKKAIDGLHGIDLNIAAGDIIGLMGPSGCGKSTLANLIAGTIKPSSGSLSSTFERTLYLSDKLFLKNQTILENFVHHALADTYNQKVTKARMACSDLEITNYINSPLEHLSTGQLQRVLLGIAMVSEAELVILDEPFSHLEQSLRHELTQIMLPIFSQNQTAVLWISHDQNLLMSHCEKVMVMNFGKILQIASPESLYFKPSKLFVADFLGLCNKELLHNNRSQIWDKDFSTNGQNPLLLFRPEAILFIDDGVEAELISTHFNGNSYIHKLEINGAQIFARTNHILEGSSYKVSINLEQVTVLPNV